VSFREFFPKAKRPKAKNDIYKCSKQVKPKLRRPKLVFGGPQMANKPCVDAALFRCPTSPSRLKRLAVNLEFNSQPNFTVGNLRRTRGLLLPRLLSGQISVRKARTSIQEALA
jgi:hypothetical protein